MDILFNEMLETINQEVAYGKKYHADADLVLENLLELLPEDNAGGILAHYIELNTIVNHIIEDGEYEIDDYDISYVSFEDIEQELNRRGFGEIYYLDMRDFKNTEYLTIDNDRYAEKTCELADRLVIDKLEELTLSYNVSNDTDLDYDEMEKFWEIYQIEQKLQGFSLMDTFTMSKGELDIINGFQIIFGNEQVATDEGREQAVLIYEYLFSGAREFLISLDDYVHHVCEFTDIYESLFESAIECVWNGWEL